MARVTFASSFFFFNDTATTEIYTLSLHDALPILCHGDESWASRRPAQRIDPPGQVVVRVLAQHGQHHVPALARKLPQDRKSTRLNSSHGYISYAVFCLKKKKRTCHGRQDVSCNDT